MKEFIGFAKLAVNDEKRYYYYRISASELSCIEPHNMGCKRKPPLYCQLSILEVFNSMAAA